MTYIIPIEEAEGNLEKLVGLLNTNDILLTKNGIPAAKLIMPDAELSLSQHEELHLEEEFAHYRELYPKVS